MWMQIRDVVGTDQRPGIGLSSLYIYLTKFLTGHLDFEPSCGIKTLMQYCLSIQHPQNLSHFFYFWRRDDLLQTQKSYHSVEKHDSIFAGTKCVQPSFNASLCHLCLKELIDASHTFGRRLELPVQSKNKRELS